MLKKIKNQHPKSDPPDLETRNPRVLRWFYLGPRVFYEEIGGQVWTRFPRQAGGFRSRVGCDLGPISSIILKLILLKLLILLA